MVYNLVKLNKPWFWKLETTKTCFILLRILYKLKSYIFAIITLLIKEILERKSKFYAQKYVSEICFHLFKKREFFNLCLNNVLFIFFYIIS